MATGKVKIKHEKNTGANLDQIDSDKSCKQKNWFVVYPLELFV